MPRALRCRLPPSRPVARAASQARGSERTRPRRGAGAGREEGAGAQGAGGHTPAHHAASREGLAARSRARPGPQAPMQAEHGQAPEEGPPECEAQRVEHRLVHEVQLLQPLLALDYDQLLCGPGALVRDKIKGELLSRELVYHHKVVRQAEEG
mmetsp:Transcript_107089/g.298256  ORF Transcript_107089/g.298256 Transcript_107089/m.298256 type:complete len:153 (+) Transcript_107089:145-603(+)